MQGTYTLRILEAAFELIWEIGPYFLISILIQVIIKQFFTVKIAILKQRHELWMIPGAALFGIFSPLPTYAAVPIGLSLIPAGLPFSAVLAFIIASPLINPSVFYLTWTQLGLPLAVARVMVAFVLGCIGGLLVYYKFKNLEKSIKKTDSFHNPVKRPMYYEFYRTVLFLGKYFLISVFISAAVKALVPAEMIGRLLGSNARSGLLVAIALGVPFYSCGGAAIPFVEVLQEMGMSSGAALTFFIAGPATKLETLFIFKNLLGGRIMGFYLILTLTGAWLAGFAFMLF